jgi:hypothetical protein
MSQEESSSHGSARYAVAELSASTFWFVVRGIYNAGLAGRHSVCVRLLVGGSLPVGHSSTAAATRGDAEEDRRHENMV